MSALPRRKAKKRIITFILVFEAQEMLVEYQANWTAGTGHFVFQSLHEPRRRIPVSETGYFSHFAPMEDVEAASSPQDYAQEIVLSLLQSRRPARRDDREQLPLF